MPFFAASEALPRPESIASRENREFPLTHPNRKFFEALQGIKSGRSGKFIPSSGNPLSSHFFGICCDDKCDRQTFVFARLLNAARPTKPGFASSRRTWEEPADTSALKALLAPFPSDGMICWPVNARVGNVKNNDASLI